MSHPSNTDPNVTRVGRPQRAANLLQDDLSMPHWIWPAAFAVGALLGVVVAGPPAKRIVHLEPAPATAPERTDAEQARAPQPGRGALAAAITTVHPGRVFEILELDSTSAIWGHDPRSRMERLEARVRLARASLPAEGQLNADTPLYPRVAPDRTELRFRPLRGTVQVWLSSTMPGLTGFRIELDGQHVQDNRDGVFRWAPRVGEQRLVVRAEGEDGTLGAPSTIHLRVGEPILARR